MHIDTNRLRRALAAVALTTSAGLALAAAGMAQAEMNAKPDPGPIHVAAGSPVEAPPGSARDSNAKRADQTVAVVERYEVAAGDSFWSIAEHQLPDHASAGEVSELAEVLIEYNVPRLGYEDKAMIKPGDVVAVVALESAAPAAPGLDRVSAPASHVVVAGDSYWAIAESVLGDDATRADVLAKTEELMALNSARLGSDDASMIHPGDVVYLAELASTPELIVREDARVLVAAAEQMTSKPTPDATVREDARVLVAAAEQMTSKPTPDATVREDARVLVAAAEQMTSKPTPDATVREDARVLVAAAEQMTSKPTPDATVREDARVLVAAAEQMTSKPTPDATVREDARVLVAAAEDGS